MRIAALTDRGAAIKIIDNREDLTMGISGITSNYQTGYEVRRTTKNTFGEGFDSAALGETKYKRKSADTIRQTSALDIYNSMSKFGGNISKATETKSILSQCGNTDGIEDASGREDWFKKNEHDHERVLSDEELEQTAGQESETKSEIIVKPDGSRVLVVTMGIGGMETTMSLEISKPTKAPNENAKQDTDHNMPTAENNAVSDDMSNVSSEA